MSQSNDMSEEDKAAANKLAIVNFEKEISNKLFPENKAFDVEDILNVSMGKKKPNAALVDKVNTIMCSDLITLQNYRENFVGFSSVLRGSRYSIAAYADAVRYVTYKVSGLTNLSSYMHTFPDRYARLLSEGLDEKSISSYVAAYNKGKLVVSLYEQSAIPVYISNSDIFQKAINKQSYLMEHSKSERIQLDAASNLMMHLKAPEKAQIELDIAVKQDAGVVEMRESLKSLAATQLALLQGGQLTARDIANSKLVDTSSNVVKVIPKGATSE